MGGIDESSVAPADNQCSNLLHALIEQSPALVAVRSISGHYLYANPAFAAAVSCPVDSLTGRHEDDILRNVPALQALRIGNAPAEAGVRHGGGITPASPDVRHFLVTRFPIRGAEGQVFANGMIATEAALHGASSPQDVETRHDELLRALEQMERLAYTDRLTGAWNRRHLEDAALIEMSRSERYSHAVALLVLDVDHFKEINDEFGHAIGDYVLVELVRCIRGNLRRTDTVTRWGGEEFIVLAPDTPLEEAKRMARKLCARIATARLSSAHEVTVSVGVAEYQCGESFEQWVARADQAMYSAKAAGRNRVAAAPYTAFGVDGSRIDHVPVQLVWRDAYRSGDESVDGQHRQLFEHANSLLQAVFSDAPHERTIEAMRLLIADIAAHFADEERLHAAIAFPGREKHAADHARLLEKATRLFDSSRHGDSFPAAEVFHFLAYDIVAQHLIAADRLYFPYLEAPGSQTLQPA